MQIEKQSITRILVRGTNWVGDAVMTLPAVAAIRENFPGAHLTVLARPWVQPVYAAHPGVDRVMAYGKRAGALAPVAQMMRTARKVRRERFDLAILFQNAFEAALIAFLARIPLRAGYDTDGRRWLLTHPVPRKQAPAGAHQSSYYLSILGALGWRDDFSAPALRVSPSDAGQVDQMLATRGIAPGDRLVGIGPGAIYGPAKRWPAECFAQLADRVAHRWGARVAVFGSGGEKGVCDAVQAAMTHPSINLCGHTSLGAAMAAIRRCRLFVTNDSGLMHVAAALGVPTVAVFGSTDPIATGPLGPFTQVVQVDTSCSPCFLRTCPIDFACMRGISVDVVWNAVCDMKQRSHDARPWRPLVIDRVPVGNNDGQYGNDKM